MSRQNNALPQMVEPLWSTYIHQKGARLGLPVTGTFELTPRCNFNCHMCYVHQTEAQAAQGGLDALWEQLRQVDPETAARLHPHDAKRIIRALEVWYDTGQTISQHNRQTQTQPPRYQGVTIALTYRDRQDLYQRIDQRVDQMMARGLAEEVRALLAAGIPRTSTAMQAIGYKELVRALDAGGDLAPAVEEIKRRSRQYAKRQLTWFRRNQEVHWLLWEREPDFSAAVQDSTQLVHASGLQ